MKKIISIFVICMMLATMFVGCGKKEAVAEETDSFIKTIEVKEIQVETILVEDIIVEDIIVENVIGYDDVTNSWDDID